MNILVFGGTRYMGRHLVKALLAQGHRVTIATRGTTKDEFGDRVARILVDRTDPVQLKNRVPNAWYDVVYDSLAYCSNDVKYLLDTVRCWRYIQISTMSVYETLHENLKEDEFDPAAKSLIYCNRDDFTYGRTKQLAECAVVQAYPQVPAVRVRFPFVISRDDYTRRFQFYIDHIVKQTPIYVDNRSSKLSFVHSEEAGKFLSFLAGSEFTGAINAASEETLSIEEMADYIQSVTGSSPLLSAQGEKAPYNGADSYSLNTDRAKALGFQFTPLTHWIYDLIGDGITQAKG